MFCAIVALAETLAGGLPGRSLAETISLGRLAQPPHDSLQSRRGSQRGDAQEISTIRTKMIAPDLVLSLNVKERLLRRARGLLSVHRLSLRQGCLPCCPIGRQSNPRLHVHRLLHMLTACLNKDIVAGDARALRGRREHNNRSMDTLALDACLPSAQPDSLAPPRRP